MYDEGIALWVELGTDWSDIFNAETRLTREGVSFAKTRVVDGVAFGRIFGGIKAHRAA